MTDILDLNNIDSLTFSIQIDNLEIIKNLLKSIDNNLKIVQVYNLKNNLNLFIFKINRLTNFKSDDNLMCNILISLIKSFNNNYKLFQHPKLEPYGYYIYYKLLKKSKSNFKNYKLKYGIENILADVNYVAFSNMSIYYNGCQDYLRKHESSTDLKKIYLNKVKFDLFYENLLKEYTKFKNIDKKGKEFEFIYKTLYLLYHNKYLTKYYRDKIGNILNIHKSFYKDPIKQSFGSLVNLDKIKEELENDFHNVSSNKQLMGTIK